MQWSLMQWSLPRRSWTRRSRCQRAVESLWLAAAPCPASSFDWNPALWLDAAAPAAHHMYLCPCFLLPYVSAYALLTSDLHTRLKWRIKFQDYFGGLSLTLFDLTRLNRPKWMGFLRCCLIIELMLNEDTCCKYTMARFGSNRLDLVQFYSIWYSFCWFGLTWLGSTRLDVVRLDPI